MQRHGGHLSAQPSCKFNKQVDCEERWKKPQCDKCGWNPEVEAVRIEKLRIILEDSNEEN